MLTAGNANRIRIGIITASEKSGVTERFGRWVAVFGITCNFAVFGSRDH